ncbi:Uncharacterised protein [BD1-7 clade bacterium]|uniref:Uncharacterized protein n=1 Tax=BD1-7 clade bacterium TaxID=2029982 RepID=A0A5S9PJB5_9GAMM|nr:Uncharacterised protein [BD1-7 clade bacterium]
MKNIHYRVEVKSEGSRFIVLFNGHKIKMVAEGEPCRVDRPVNPYVLSGENNLEITVYPWSDEKLLSNESSFVTAALVAYDSEGRLGKGGKVVAELRCDHGVISGTKFSSEVEPGIYKLVDDDQSDLGSMQFVLGSLSQKMDFPVDGAVEISRDVGLSTSFSPWGYITSDTIPQVDDMSDAEFFDEFLPSIFKAYEKIHGALKRKDIDSIMPLFQERNSEMDIAFYHEPGTYEKKLRDSFQSEIDSGMILADIDIGYVQGKVSENGKLAKLDDPYLIYFHNEEKTIFNGYDIWFRRKGDRWIVSR